MRISTFIFVLAATATAIVAIPITDYCERAASSCKFNFEATCGIPSFSLGVAPNTPFTPRIVSKTSQELVGVMQSSNISPEFLYGYYYIPVFARGFSRSQFRPLTLSSHDGSAIGFEQFDGNKQQAQGQCVRVYFTAYQRQRFGGSVENVVVSAEQARRDDLCVVFRTL